MMNKYVWVCACALLGVITGYAQVGELPLDGTVKKGQLANGFTYFIKANKQPENRALLYLANKVGSILEDENEQGLAHFVEHMNFNGTKHFPKNELIDYLEKAGVKFGADLNAYTNFDETVYQLPLPTDDTALWNNGMQIMRDWAAEAALSEEEYEKERGVILEEKRLRQNVSGRMQEHYRPTLYNFSRYASRQPIGKEEVIKHAGVQVIRNFYKKWYRPDLQALIVVGDVDVDKVEHQIRALFGDMEVGRETVTRPSYSIDLKQGTNFVLAKDKEFSQYQIELCFKREKETFVTKEDFKSDLMANIVNNLFSYRWQDIARRTNPPYLAASSGVSPLIANLEMFDVRVTLSPGKMEQGFAAAWAEVERVRRFGFTETEWSEAKERFARAISLAMNEKDKRSSARLADEYLRYFLDGTAFLQVEDRVRLTEQYLSQITLEDIHGYVTAYLKEPDRTILVFGTDKEEVILPDQSQIESWISAIKGIELNPYEHHQGESALMEQQPAPGAVKAKTEIKELGLTHWVLENGVNVYAKPTDFKSDEISFTGFSPGGSSLYGDADYQSAMNAVTFMLNSGVGKLDLGQLSKVLNAKSVQVRPYINERSEGFSGASTGKDLLTALELIHLYITQPRLDTARFSAILDRSKTAMRNRVADPSRAFADTVANVLGSYHVRRKPVDIDALNQIDSTRSYQIFKERFADARDFTFVFVGSFNIDSLQSLVELYLGSLPSSGTAEHARDLKIRVPKGKIRKDLHIGQADKSTVQLVISGTYDYDAKSNLYLDALKAALSFRLTERLREKEGGVYSPSVQVTKTKQPIGFYAFVISFDCDPKKMDTLIAATQEEWANMRKNGITADDLQKFKAEETRNHEVQLRSNQFWLGYLQGQLERDEPLNEVLRFPQTIEKLSEADIKKQAKRLLRTDNKIIITLSPEIKQ